MDADLALLIAFVVLCVGILLFFAAEQLPEIRIRITSKPFPLSERMARTADLVEPKDLQFSQSINAQRSLRMERGR